MSNMMASALSPRALSIIFCLWPGTNIQDRFKSIFSFSQPVPYLKREEMSIIAIFITGSVARMHRA
jgi:hypothetical protein